MIKILGLKGVKNMSKTVVRKNESLDDALRRFKRAVTKAAEKAQNLGKKEEAVEEEAPAPIQEELLTEIRDLLANK